MSTYRPDSEDINNVSYTSLDEKGVKHLTFRSKQAHFKICSPLPRGD